MKKFYLKKRKVYTAYSAIRLETKEHFFELSDRLAQFSVLSIFLFLVGLLSTNTFSEIFLTLIPEIEFFQLSPQEYVITSILTLSKLILLLLFPHFLRILLFFFGPSLLLNEKKTIFPLIGISILSSLIAIFLSFNILAPITFQFFLRYNAENIEPLWSFNDFAGFLIKLIYINLILFQLPIFQIILHKTNVVSVNKMISSWKQIIFITFIVSGILTPSTDPFTQISLSGIILCLYGSGILFSKFLY